MNIVLTELYKDYWQGAGCAKECKMSDWLNRCHVGDVRDVLKRMIADGVKVQTIVTSPPYWGLRSYLPADHPDKAREIGSEPTLDEFLSTMVGVFDLCHQVLADDGTMWVNMGDSYSSGGRTHVRDPDNKNAAVGDGQQRPATPAGLKPKDLIGQPWRLAFALQDAGWYLRQDIIWHKPNPMPESVRDRCTKAHEYIFLLSKTETYYFDAEAMKEPSVTNDPRRPYTSKGAKDLDGRSEWKSGQARDKGDFSLRNKRSVWTVTTKPFKGAHFATFPTELIEPCILAGAPAGGIVLDPFFGSGTTGQVSQALGRQFIGLELNEAYKPLQDERLRQPSLMLEAA